MTVKNLLVLAAALSMSGAAFAQDKKETAPAKPEAKQPEVKKDEKAAKNIVETAMGTGMHTTLCGLLKEAGLVEALSDSKEKFTVFAPTDDAFKKVDAKALASLKADKKALTKVLTFHVIKGAAVMAKDVVTMKESVATIEGSKFNIVVKDGKVSIGNSKGMANVIKTDVVCSNGVIHVIDGVMMAEDAKKEVKKEETKKGS